MLQFNEFKGLSNVLDKIKLSSWIPERTAAEQLFCLSFFASFLVSFNS